VKYLIGFIAGLAVALIILVKAAPDATATMQGTTIAQGGQISDSALKALATCLINSGFTAPQDVTPQPVIPNPNPSPNISYINGRVIAKSCLQLREEEDIERGLRCMEYGEDVQVILKNGKPITPKYAPADTPEYGPDDYVFVISYKRGKGWAARKYLDY
jgi:hypothetical protein